MTSGSLQQPLPHRHGKAMETGLPLLDLLRVIFLFRRADANKGTAPVPTAFPHLMVWKRLLKTTYTVPGELRPPE